MSVVTELEKKIGRMEATYRMAVDDLDVSEVGGFIDEDEIARRNRELERDRVEMKEARAKLARLRGEQPKRRISTRFFITILALLIAVMSLWWGVVSGQI